LVHLGSWDSSMVNAHAPTAEGGEAALASLVAAWTAVREGQARAIVTAPVSKEAIVLSGTPFVGQTEFLARSVGLENDDVTMMFLGPKLSVALVTTHLAIRDVSDAITKPRVARAMSHLAQALRVRYPDHERLRMLVTGLNPHAGENGLFGREEIDVIEPVIQTWPAIRPIGTEHVVAEGPVPAEAAFRAANGNLVVGIVAMMHDQATIASKLLDWGRAVNVTWGLPFVRTSVDHGVAYDAARSGSGEDSGMRAAIKMAQRLTESSRA
jgi:4-hydroxythreonine-4-phosphate dehydrogenase